MVLVRRLLCDGIVFARLAVAQAQAAQRARLADLRREMAFAISHLEVRVPLPDRLRALLCLPAFSRGCNESDDGRNGAREELEHAESEGEVTRALEGGGQGRRGNLASRAFTLWTQIEEYACDKIRKEILTTAGMELPEDWGTKAALACMHGGVWMGVRVRYFKDGDLAGQELEGTVAKIGPGVTSDGHAKAGFNKSLQAWLRATLDGSRGDPGRPTLAELSVESSSRGGGTAKLANCGARAVRPEAGATPDVSSGGPLENRAAGLATDVIGLKWAELMDVFLVRELEVALKEKVDESLKEGAELQVPLDVAQRSRHRVREMLNAAAQSMRLVEEQSRALQQEAADAGVDGVVDAAKALCAQAQHTHWAWQGSMQGIEHHMSCVVDAVAKRLEERTDYNRERMSCWDQLRGISVASGAFVAYNPPDNHLEVKGRESEVRDAVARLRRLIEEDACFGCRAISIGISPELSAKLAKDECMLLHVVKAQARLRDVSLDTATCELKLTGMDAPLMIAAKMVGVELPPHPDVRPPPRKLQVKTSRSPRLAPLLPPFDKSKLAACLICLDSSAPLMDLLCGHRCHAECLRRGHDFRAESARQVGREEPARCPASAELNGAGGCPHILTPSEAREVFGSGAAVVAHLQAQIELRVRAHPDARSCTQCSALALATSDNLPLTCVACGTSFCGSRSGRCLKRPHYFSTCAQLEHGCRAHKRRCTGEAEALGAEESAGRATSSDAASRWPPDIVLCGRCCCPIGREEGVNSECKYMRCKLCAYEFCWLCLQPANDHRHIDPAEPRRTPDCDNMNGQSPENREIRRLTIIEGSCSGVSRVALPVGQVPCDRCGQREGLNKMFACLECLNSYVCEECEPGGCPRDAGHVLDTLELFASPPPEAAPYPEAPAIEVGLAPPPQDQDRGGGGAAQLTGNRALAAGAGEGAAVEGIIPAGFWADATFEVVTKSSKGRAVCGSRCGGYGAMRQGASRDSSVSAPEWRLIRALTGIERSFDA